MSANLTAALQISLIGMSFVLAALVLLWLVIAVLVRLTAEPVAPPPKPAADQALRQRAAAVAVAVALAAQPPNAARPITARLAPQLSPWQAARRTQLLKQRERQR